MMKRIIGIVVFSALAGVAFAGETFELNRSTGKDISGVDLDHGTGDIKAVLSGIDIPQVSSPAPEKGWFSHNNTLPPAPKEWTVLVYVNGKNDLEAAALYNLNKMELVGSNDSMNIVAEVGRMRGQDNDVDLDGDWTGSRRYYVRQDSNEKKVKSKVMQSFDKVDMGDWRHLVDFAKWGMKNYPAKYPVLYN